MRSVSIPFIAGQWSLRPRRRMAARRARRSQSPSLRGSGRFRPTAALVIAGAMSQSPSLRGSGRFALRAAPRLALGGVSIPFIAGQWSLPPPKGGAIRLRIRSQSPSLRGSGRFPQSVSRRADPQGGFNPLHCGAVVASAEARAEAEAKARVSIPFIAGQWSLRRSARSVR